MPKSVIEELAQFGQSVWLDNISRSLIETGKIKEMIDLGLRGITSNPTIFDKAISKSSIYDTQIEDLRRVDKSTFEIYDDLTVKDIKDTADLFLPVYKNTGRRDGYVSLEVNPKLAFNAQETIKEAIRLQQKVDRPNVMFKIPATREGFPAITYLLGRGMNINATLIFSLGQYVNTAQAYIRGINELLKNKGDVRKVHSVASVFVSRVDTVIDRLLDDRIAKEENEQKGEEFLSLKGKAAVSNCNLIYSKYSEIFSSSEFKALKDKGANIQRALWASTSTKNPDYSDIKYIRELIAKNTVNTIPDNTLDAFLNHGVVEPALTAGFSEAKKAIDSLRSMRIDIDEVCAKLLSDGVIAFEKSFESLLNSIEEKSSAILR